MKNISRAVWVLSFISLFTDAASEMLYPVMPVYLKSIGFSVVLIGVLEGLAEATAGLSKGFFGRMSDSSGKRVPFVQAGYALSAFSKPMMALFAVPLWVFFSRTLDRLGKGIRTGARDALLSDEATPRTKGKIFGLHRAMDTTGAVIGPAFAWLYLHFYPEVYTPLFFIAFVPGLLAIAASFLLKEKPKDPKAIVHKTNLLAAFRYWKESPAAYRQLVGALVVFALANSSDVFLLLQAKQSGLSDSHVIGLYIFYNMIYALAALPLGLMADRIGLKRTFIAGLIVFAIVYFAMAGRPSGFMLPFLFFLYGLYAAATEGIAKAWISNISSRADTATALGSYAGFQSIAAFAASSITGCLWYIWGAPAAFVCTALISVAVALYLILLPDTAASAAA